MTDLAAILVVGSSAVAAAASTFASRRVFPSTLKVTNESLDTPLSAVGPEREVEVEPVVEAAFDPGLSAVGPEGKAEAEPVVEVASDTPLSAVGPDREPAAEVASDDAAQAEPEEQQDQSSPAGDTSGKSAEAAGATEQSTTPGPAEDVDLWSNVLLAGMIGGAAPLGAAFAGRARELAEASQEVGQREIHSTAERLRAKDDVAHKDLLLLATEIEHSLREASLLETSEASIRQQVANARDAASSADTDEVRTWILALQKLRRTVLGQVPSHVDSFQWMRAALPEAHLRQLQSRYRLTDFFETASRREEYFGLAGKIAENLAAYVGYSPEPQALRSAIAAVLAQDEALFEYIQKDAGNDVLSDPDQYQRLIRAAAGTLTGLWLTSEGTAYTTLLNKLKAVDQPAEDPPSL